MKADEYGAFPKVCCWCGGKILRSKADWGCDHDYRTGVSSSWHNGCGSGPKR